MGRRKIEIKAIKDDRNRSVTFLKRKGGLFKKAHELSVLCSVDVAVFIFGSNKKLYEYSSSAMPDLMTRYHYHGGVNEHKGPSDFNGGAEDEGSDDENGSPPQVEGLEHMPMNFHGQPPFPHPHMRHHTPSASPPIQNGAFVPHPAHPIHRGHTPQPPHMGSRPSSRNDIRRIGPNMGQPNGPPGPPQPAQVNGYAYMPHPAIYNPQNQPNMPHGLQQPGAQYAVYPPQQAHAHQMQSYMEDQRRSSLPPNFPPPGPQQGPPQVQRHSVSPPQPTTSQLPAQPVARMSPPPPQHQQHLMQSPPLPQHHQQQQQQQDEQQRQQQYHQQQNQQSQAQQQQQQQSQQPPQVQVQEPLAPPLPDIKPEPNKSMRQPPLLGLDTQVKRLPQRKGGSIFTPIDGPSSMLAQHLSAFLSSSDPSKSDGNRSHSVDVGSISRSNPTSSPPQPPRSNAQQPPNKRHDSISIPERTFTPPSRTNSLQTPGGAARPRLKVQIPEEASEAGSATAGSSSPRNTSTDNTSQHSRGMVLPPPSPSVEGGNSLLSAGPTGPPNPFARTVRQNDQQQQHQSMNIDTPVSALPSRMMGNEFLPSPSSFYPDWNYRGNESNTLPSPLNFATPVVGTGPSFLRDDPTPQHKRKSPEISGSHGAGHEGADHGNEAKRIKVDS